MFELLRGWLFELLSALGLYNKTGTLVVLGLDNAGKSTLLHKLVHNKISTSCPTESAQLEEFQLGGITFKAWDLGGHEAVRFTWAEYYTAVPGQAVLFLVDAVDEGRLPEANWEFKELMGQVGEDQPVAVLFNKCDSPAALPDEVLNAQLEWQAFEQSRNIAAFRISVYDGVGYQEAIQYISQFI